MLMSLALLAGVLLAFALIRIARRRSSPLRPYAVGLIVAALAYVLFAIVGGASARWLVIEIAGVFVFGVLALLGLRAFPLILALGWAIHVAWDVLLHLHGAGALFTPRWYPWLCVSFDLVVAGAVVKSLGGPPKTASRFAA
jgi:hypothetical protein